jgi:Cu-Zn family superoxide dismutase
MSLAKDNKSVIGRSVVVHVKQDDLKTQPSGDSGARVACGVIGAAKNP